MLDAVGVHGISQQQGGRHQLLDDWLRALTDGVEAARGRAAVQPPLTFDLGYYGNLFLADWPTADKGPADPEVVEAVADDLSEEERVWFAEIAAELPVEQVPPTKGCSPGCHAPCSGWPRGSTRRSGRPPPSCSSAISGRSASISRTTHWPGRCKAGCRRPWPMAARS